MSIRIIDDIIYDGTKILNSIDIYNRKDDLKKIGIKVSIVNLNGKVMFCIQDDDILIRIVSFHGGKNSFVAREEDEPLDYIVIDGKVYFLNFDFTLFHSILKKYNCKINSKIAFSDYLFLKKELLESSFDIIDDVNDKVENTKSFSPQTIGLSSINAKLFEYQKVGFNWLSFMYRNNCGAILADEMGLGKTLQVITLMAYIKNVQSDVHFLVICPLSLLENWKREVHRFCPSLKVIVHHGKNRLSNYKDLQKFDVVITSYSNCQSDLGMINMIKWDLLVIDEAQNIKNPRANRTISIKQVNKRCGIAVTGTPFENHIEDVWSIVDFVLPNYFGTLSSFKRNYNDDLISASIVEPMLSEIMIRRRVKDVADDLPNRIDIPQPIIMDDSEAQLYEKRRCVSSTSLKSLNIEKIQGLRMFCTHPYVYNHDSCSFDDPKDCSAKYQRLCEIVEEIIENGEKVLVFTSFNRMNELIVSDLSKRFGTKAFSITGSTEVGMRQKIIDMFSSENGAAILVLNPKAAGAGLNITAANHVIHYNLEWNPAIEDQASARAFRKGQQKKVFVYRLFYVDTIEEIMNERIERKREISDTLIKGNNGETDQNDLLRAINLSPLGRVDNA